MKRVLFIFLCLLLIQINHPISAQTEALESYWYQFRGFAVSWLSKEGETRKLSVKVHSPSFHS